MIHLYLFIENIVYASIFCLAAFLILATSIPLLSLQKTF